MSKILVTYKTATNTTKEIAEEISKILSEHGLTVDVRPLEEVANMDEYTGVVVGAPINGMKWVSEADAFIQEKQNMLKTKKVALFAVAYLLYDGCKFWQKRIKSSLNKLKALVNTSKVGIFGGKIEKMFPSVPRFLFGVRKDAPLDTRNWDHIRQWAYELAEYFNE